MSAKCKVDEDCTLPGEVDKQTAVINEMRVLVENHTENWNKKEEKAKVDRKAYRIKIDGICSTVEKIDRALTGDKFTKAPGLIAEVNYIKQYSGVAKFLNGVWRIVKKPVITVIVLFILGVFGFMSMLFIKSGGLEYVLNALK